jgi:hypothetical protein
VSTEVEAAAEADDDIDIVDNDPDISVEVDDAARVRESRAMKARSFMVGEESMLGDGSEVE